VLPPVTDLLTDVRDVAVRNSRNHYAPFGLRLDSTMTLARVVNDSLVVNTFLPLERWPYSSEMRVRTGSGSRSQSHAIFQPRLVECHSRYRSLTGDIVGDMHVAGHFHIRVWVGMLITLPYRTYHTYQ